jgi:signal transduction histidine kinase
MSKGFQPRPGQASGKVRGGGQNKTKDQATLYPQSSITRERQALAPPALGLPAIIHRLSQPLTALHGALELALMTSRSIEEYRSALKEMLTQADSLLSMLGSLRELVDAEELGGSNEAARLEVLAEEAIGELRPLADSRSVSLTFNPRGTLPLRADVGKLRLAVYKVIHHAVAGSPKRGAVRVSLFTDDRNAYFEVVHQGRLPAPDEIAHLTKAVSLGALFSEASMRGTLEWAVAKRLFENQDGIVQVEARPGEGSCFRVLWRITPQNPV